MINNFVGGYAGSGTRVIQEMLENYGLWVGSKKNHRVTFDTHDTLVDFSKVAVVQRKFTKEITDLFLQHILEFQEGHQDWSIKNGESMWAIPFIRGLFPQATYILVVKNGLDNILNHHSFAEVYFEHFIDSDEQNFWYRRMKYWSKIYSLAVEEGEECFGDKFLIVRLEDIIWNPVQEGQRIFTHLGLKFKDEYISFVKPQESVGRHETLWTECHGHIYDPVKHLDTIKDLGKEMLTRFGYKN